MPSPIRLPIEEGRIQLFWLTNPNTSLVCDKLLRCVPGKRWVCLAHWGEQVVIARVFADHQEAQRVLMGAQLLSSAQIKTPKVLYHGWTVDKAHYIILFEYIESAQDLCVVWSFADENARKELLRNLVMLTAQLHSVGLRHNHLYLKNFLQHDTAIHVLGTSSVVATKDKQPVTEEASLKNLALLFAQLPSRYDTLCVELYPFYIKQRDLVYTLSGVMLLKKWIAYWRRRRLALFAREVFRSGNHFVTYKNWKNFSVCDRGYDTATMRALLAKPHQIIQGLDTTVLKSDQGCTVSKVMIDGHALLIKHYVPKGLGQRLKQLFSRSSAARYWRNAQHLRVLDIATPKPVAMLEKRWGLLRLESYFIAEYMGGNNLEDYFSRDDLALLHTPEQLTLLAENILGLFADLADMQITHGNLRASNILLSQVQPILLHLETMRLHNSIWRWQRLAVRDRKRFMQNWQNHPEATWVFRLIGLNKAN